MNLMKSFLGKKWGLGIGFLITIFTACAGPAKPPPFDNLKSSTEEKIANEKDLGERKNISSISPKPAKLVIPREIRGIWVTRWDYKTPEDIITIMDKISRAHLNTVIFQVRGRSDAFYRSSLEPWAEELTGTLGLDPGWDPLEIAIDAAHTRNLNIHAWINTLTCWRGDPPPSTTDPQHIYHAHPDWLQISRNHDLKASQNDYSFLCPANPNVKNHILKITEELTTGYNIDGLHLDYIRYAGRNFSYDTTSRYRFIAENRNGVNWADWQRSQLNSLIHDLNIRLKHIKPDLFLSAAVWGIYIDKWKWNCSEGFQNYYQDSHAWIERGDLDSICPMIYWPIGSKPDFETLLNDFVNRSGGENLLPGIKCDYPDPQEIIHQIEACRRRNTLGFFLFAYSNLDEYGYWNDMTEFLDEKSAVTVGK